MSNKRLQPNPELREKFEVKHHISTEPRRWLILLGFSLLGFSNALPWSAYATIIVNTEEYYGIGESEYIQFFNVYVYGIVASIIPFSYYSPNYLSVCLLICTALNNLGTAIKWFAGANYTAAVFGQTLLGLAQGCTVQVPAVLSERWFSSKEGAWALLISNYSLYLGGVAGSIFPSLIVKDETLSTGFSKLHFYELLLTLVPTIILVFSLKNKPKNPPSIAAYIKENMPQQSLREIFTDLFANKEFMKNMFCVGYILGVSFTVTTITSSILTPRGYTAHDLSLVTSSYMIPGILLSIAGTFYLGKQTSKDYDFMIKIFLVMGILGLLGLAIAGADAYLWVILVSNAFIGFGFIAFVPFAYESLIEASYPQSEAFALAFTTIVSQVASCVFNIIATMGVVGDQGYWALTILTLPAVLYGLFFYKTNYRRTQSEIDSEKDVSCSEGSESLLSFQNPETESPKK